MQDQRNLLLAIVISVAILYGSQLLFPSPPPEPPAPAETTGAPLPAPAEVPAAGVPTPPAPAGAEAPAPAAPPAGPRVTIERGAHGRLTGSIALIGGRLDSLTLADYQETVDADSPPIRLLAPPGSAHPYFADFGWTADADAGIALPGPDTPWRASGATLTPETPVTLSWDNGAGLAFERTVAVDDDFMFTVTQRVRNHGEAAVTLYGYGLVSRTDEPKTLGYYILHEGPLGVLDGKLKEVDYDDLRESATIDQSTTGGWIGITDKYWLAALIPDQASTVRTRFSFIRSDGRDKFQVDYLLPALEVAPGASAEVSSRLFAGAKEVTLLDRYEEQLGIARFDLAVDFGWFYFLTKPLFYVIHTFSRWLGNFGLAILLLTVLIKLVFYPLANKSYTAMSKLKKLQPEMMKLREQCGDDKQKLNAEVMALYKREKANPLAGCLPIVVQIPVFFALYKVLFVTIEMRHAPFYGWIHDLSVPDPTNLFTVFGLLPLTLPDFLSIGVWPLLMGVTMFLQQKLNPTPPDPTQAKIMMLLPVMFTFLFARFPAGLVIYWTWNNLLSIAQQWVIMRRMGVRA